MHRAAIKSSQSQQLSKTQGNWLPLQPNAHPCENVHSAVVGDKGLEPLSNSSRNTAGSDFGYAKSDADSTDLRLIIHAWASLPPALQAGIVAMVKAASKS